MSDEYTDMHYEMDKQEYEIYENEKRIQSLPKLLFKFKALNSVMDLDRFIDILKNHRIYMPNYKKLNDPLEGTNAQLLEVDEKVRDEIRKSWQILALCEDGLLPTMWAYYANNYAGACIAFKTNPTFEDIKNVDYIDKHVSWSCDPDAFTENEFTKKSACWSYEKEWRILRRAIYDDSGEVINKYLEFRPDDIAHVFVGYKTAKDTENIVDVIRSNVSESAQLWIVKPETYHFCLRAENINNGKTINNITELLEER